MTYVDGFVIAVPTANREKYKDVAVAAAAVFKKHGALKVVECWGEDIPDGEVTSFPMAVKASAEETVVFSWILWPDKATREAGMKNAMEDPDMNMDMASMPFDGKRVIFGGFDILLDA